MALPELGSGVWIGIGFGILGISFWIVGLLVFARLMKRFDEDQPDDA